MEADDLLCSRNARSKKDKTGSLVVLLLAERARSECARSTRAIEDQPGHPLPAPYGEVEESEGPRSTVAVESFSHPYWLG